MRSGLPADLVFIDTFRIATHRAPLVLLAAGMGSRFGGVKPVAPVGPRGEALIAIAVEQALTAGFDDVVAVVGPATEGPVRDVLHSLPVRYAHQVVAMGRLRPWGTVDAVLCAAALAGTTAVVVANGDDLYGSAALVVARDWIASPSTAAGAAVLFEVARTLPPTGAVSRAVAVVVGSSLRGAYEERDVQLDGGAIRTGSGVELPANTLVSMNLWCLRAHGLDALRQHHAAFVGAHTDDPLVEDGLPTAVNELIGSGLGFDAVVTDSKWHGVTWPDDVDRVRRELLLDES